MKRATDSPFKNIQFPDISIHALVKRATFLSLLTPFVPHDFNPRPREEGDLLSGSVILYFFVISIHALVKRATSIGYYLFHSSGISIHALVKRATLYIYNRER